MKTKGRNVMGNWSKRLISLLIISSLLTGAYGVVRSLGTNQRLVEIREEPWYSDFHAFVDQNEITKSEITLACRAECRVSRMDISLIVAFLAIAFCHGTYLLLFLGVHTLVKKLFKTKKERAQQQNPELSPAAVAPDEA
jgi:hypothetical protein